MGNKSTSGFTIIESVLFLAISGVLVVTLFAGTGVSINIQRYRDAVETFKSLLQDQYSGLASVKNARPDTWSCDENAKTEEGNNAIPRGQSDCLLVGRYVTVVGGKISAFTVTAREKTNPPQTATTDIDKLSTEYELSVSTVDSEVSEMEWGTSIAWPTTGSEGQTGDEQRSIAILFIRSPESGKIYTFTSNDVADEPTSDSLKQLSGSRRMKFLGKSSELFVLIQVGHLPGQHFLAVICMQLSSGPTRLVRVLSKLNRTTSVETRHAKATPEGRHFN